MRRTLVLGSLVFGVITACHLPTKRNPDACCTTQTDCDAIGLPLGSDCDDSRVCVQNQCVTPTTCQGDSDCMMPTPFCAPNGTCVECLDASSCSDPLSVCGPTNSCVECVDSTTCGDKVCDTSTNVCRGCNNDSECANGFCSLESHLCRRSIVPKYLPTICDTPATDASLVLVANTSLNTDADAMCNGGVVAQSQAPEICVLRYGSIMVPTAVTFRASGTRLIALVADDALSIDGILDISADASTLTNGPGGGSIVNGGGVGVHIGGGGAGFRTDGAAGGDATATGGAANGGTAINPLLNPALIGGPVSNNGGGAGGGATLISCRGSISVAGTIDAGGSGGRAGKIAAGMSFGGGGGNAGGYVVLQAHVIDVTGRVYANGGGGGAGLGGPAIFGGDGNRSLVPALGGGTYPNEAAGGAGAAGTSLPTGGIRSIAAANTAGGGGGSMGFFQTYTPVGFTPTLAPAEASPGFEPNLTIDTR
jgi:hypothetical protein